VRPFTISAAAVASDISLRRFHLARRSARFNALSEYGTSQSRWRAEERTVPTFNSTAAWRFLPAPRIIKCDVEGAEIEVFGISLNVHRSAPDHYLRGVRGKRSGDRSLCSSAPTTGLFDGEASIIGQRISSGLLEHIGYSG